MFGYLPMEVSQSLFPFNVKFEHVRFQSSAGFWDHLLLSFSSNFLLKYANRELYKP